MIKRSKICLWSSPRNISTAMMYSFAQRPDTIVFDEPLYAHYLKVTGSNHPGREEVLASQDNNGEHVIKNIILADYDKPVSFFKQMTHHLVDLDEVFLGRVQNILFIRNPKQIIRSYAEVRSDVTLPDIGIQKQWYLFNLLREKNYPWVIVDSNELLKDPEKLLRNLCDRLEIPFYPAMLKWEAGPKKEDGVWAKYWYANVHLSTGFSKQKTSDRALPSHLEPLYEESRKYYDLLYPYALKV